MNRQAIVTDTKEITINKKHQLEKAVIHGYFSNLNNDYSSNLSALSVKDNISCLYSHPASSTIYISASSAVYPASIIIQFSSNSEISSNVEIVVLGCCQIFQHFFCSKYC